MSTSLDLGDENQKSLSVLVKYEYTPDKSLTLLRLNAKLSQSFYGSTGYECIRETKKREENIFLALAYRPTGLDKLNLLGKYEVGSRNELNSKTITSSTASLEAIYDLTSKLTVSGKYAFKLARETVSVRTELLIGRASYSLTPKLDLTGEYRLYQQSTDNDWKRNYRGELGYRLSEELRVAIGYNFLSYVDPIFPSANYEGKGPYLRVGWIVN